MPHRQVVTRPSWADSRAWGQVMGHRRIEQPAPVTRHALHRLWPRAALVPAVLDPCERTPPSATAHGLVARQFSRDRHDDGSPTRSGRNDVSPRSLIASFKHQQHRHEPEGRGHVGHRHQASAHDARASAPRGHAQHSFCRSDTATAPPSAPDDVGRNLGSSCMTVLPRTGIGAAAGYSAGRVAPRSRRPFVCTPRRLTTPMSSPSVARAARYEMDADDPNSRPRGCMILTPTDHHPVHRGAGGQGGQEPCTSTCGRAPH